MIIADPLHPCCVKCRRPFRKAGGPKSLSWRCWRCGVTIARRRKRSQGHPTLHPLPVEIVARPICVRCCREMCREAVARGKDQRVRISWGCGQCKVRTVVVREGQHARLARDVTRPSCPQCSAPMRRGGMREGRQRWRCKPCRILTAQPEAYRRNALPERPACPRCSTVMRSRGLSRKGGGRYWGCPACKSTGDPSAHEPRGLTPPKLTESEASDLLASVSRLLPRWLTADAREDARQAIALAILEGSAGRTPKPATVRRLSRAAIGLCDRFKFLSLDAPIPGTDGLTRAELLIG